jgi:hypothetical protein
LTFARLLVTTTLHASHCVTLLCEIVVINYIRLPKTRIPARF